MGNSLVTTTASSLVKKMLDTASIQTTLADIGVTQQNFQKLAVMALRKSPKLMDCNMASIAECLIISVSLNLEPNTPLQHAHIIPYGNEAKFMLDYRGLVELCRRSGELEDIYADVVREGDTFKKVGGLHRNLIHEEGEGNEDAPITHAYAVAKLKSSPEKSFEIIKKSDVDKILKVVKKGKAGDAWKNWESEMWKKTAIRRLMKLLPSSIIDKRARTYLDEYEDREFNAPNVKVLEAGNFDFREKKEPSTEPVTVEDLENEDDDI